MFQAIEASDINIIYYILAHSWIYSQDTAQFSKKKGYSLYPKNYNILEFKKKFKTLREWNLCATTTLKKL